MNNIKLSIIIINYNTAKISVNCINSVIKHTKNLNYEIIVIDNASTDNSVKNIKKLFNHQSLTIKHSLLVNEQNIGFAAANNQGLKKANGEYVLFLNSDTIISDNAISEMVEFMHTHTKVGIASCMLKNKDGSIQPTGGYFPKLISVFSWMTIQDLPFVDSFIKPFHPHIAFYKQPHYLDWVTGAFFMTRKKVFDQIGSWDESYFMYTEEVDVCYRAKKNGWKVYYNPNHSIIHLGGASGTKESSILREYEGVKRFYKKHYPKWQYPLLRFLLKVGSLGRVLILGIIEGGQSAKIYAKAFWKA